MTPKYRVLAMLDGGAMCASAMLNVLRFYFNFDARM